MGGRGQQGAVPSNHVSVGRLTVLLAMMRFYD